jgi:hypothetical protein
MVKKTIPKAWPAVDLQLLEQPFDHSRVKHQQPLTIGENGEKTLPIVWPPGDFSLIEQLSGD